MMWFLPSCLYMLEQKDIIRSYVGRRCQRFGDPRAYGGTRNDLNREVMAILAMSAGFTDVDFTEESAARCLGDEIQQYLERG